MAPRGTAYVTYVASVKVAMFCISVVILTVPRALHLILEVSLSQSVQTVAESISVALSQICERGLP